MVLQGVMGGMIVLLTYALGKRISQNAGLLAAALVAIDPLSVGFSAALLTETPFTLCLMVALWLCLRIVEIGELPKSWRLWVALGIVWGMGVYLRASALWAIFPLCIALDYFTNSPLKNARSVLVWVGVPLLPLILVFALLSPWLIRNYAIFHSGPLRLTTLEGVSLYEAVYPQANGGPKQDQINQNIPPEMQSLDEAQRNDEWGRRAWSHIAGDPLRIAKLALIKIGRTWSPWFNAADFSARPIQWAMVLWNVPLLVLALAGLCSTMPRGLRVLLLIPLGYFTAVHALFLGSVRYRAPLMPLVCLLAAHGILQALKSLRGGQR
jgi:4-amino-4-deoxy-L-arabinose transferase-like glycosyltransferase